MSEQSSRGVQDRDALAAVLVGWALSNLGFFPVEIPPQVFLGLGVAVLGWSVVNGD
jgi:hypothetical protein